MIEYEAFVGHVRQDGERLAAVATGNLAADVPPCPGWTVRDLGAHVAEVYEHKIACTELGHAPDPWPPAWPGDRDPLGWLREAHGRLLAMFERSGPTTPSATWWPPDQTVGFWARRRAQETAVHRVDAELAAGSSPTPIDAELAVDGVDEILSIMLEGDWSDDADARATGQLVGISAGDVAWGVTLDRVSVAITPGTSVGTASISGDPSDVLLWLWGRAGDERVTRAGDEDALGVLRDRLVLATQ
ncbi:MAG: maleylpyruvate isomerase family mycothiol-dependent enzyme [Actinomycetota bacterium]